MSEREQLARVLYEAPSSVDEYPPEDVWPPKQTDDRIWWLEHADAVIAAGWVKKGKNR